MLCDLGVDMAPGIQVYEASWLVAAHIRLEVKVAAILLQVGTFGSLRTHYRMPPVASSLTGLVEYLRRDYSDSHEVFLVRSTGAADQEGHIRETRLGDLCKVATVDLLNCSMYIPPIELTRLDDQFIAAMQKV